MSTYVTCDGDCEIPTITGAAVFVTGTRKVLVKEGADTAHMRIRTDEIPFDLCEYCATKAFSRIGLSTERLLIGPEYDINPPRRDKE